MLSRKAISPLVAVVLLILVVAIAGIAIYKWYKAQAGVVGEKTGGVIGEMAKGQAYLEITGLYVKPDGIYVVIRNTGTVTATNVKIYVSNIPENKVLSIKPKESKEIKLENLKLESISPGDSIAIKVVGSNAQASRVFTAMFNDNWNMNFANWNYMRVIDVKGTKQEVENAIVEVVLNESNFDFEKSNNLQDLRFVDELGNLLDYYVAVYNESQKFALIYVKLNKLAPSGARIYMYYGNGKASSLSNANRVCLQVIDGLIAAWSFDEGSGTVSYDLTGQGHNIYVVSGPHVGEWVEGKYGYAYKFHGHGWIGTSFGTGIGKGVSYVLWFKLPDTSDVGGTFMCAEDASNGDLEDNLGQTDYGDSICGSNYKLSKFNVDDTDWHFYALSKSTSSLLCRDRECEVVGDITGNIPNIKLIYFNGGCGCGYGNFAQGIIIDEVKLFNKTLSQDEIGALYENYGLVLTDKVCVIPKEEGPDIPQGPLAETEQAKVWFA